MPVSSGYRGRVRLVFGRQVVSLNKAIIRIGRVSEGSLGPNDIVCGSDEEGVSRHHAEIRLADEEVLVFDLSQNGTFLYRQGKQHALSGGSMTLCDGDVIQFAEGPKCRVEIRAEAGSMGKKATKSVGRTTFMEVVKQVRGQARSVGRRMTVMVTGLVVVGIVVVAVFVGRFGSIEQKGTQTEKRLDRQEEELDEAQEKLEQVEKRAREIERTAKEKGYSREELEELKRMLKKAGDRPAWIPPDTELELAASVLKNVGPAVVRIYAENEKGASTGSGFFINREGHIVTNKHVIDGAEKISISLDSKHERSNAILVGVHPKLDLALLQARVSKIVEAKLADADHVEKGETVVALGYPVGFTSLHTTKGIVSNKMRQYMESSVEADVIITDAPLNPGNSGGPLIDRDLSVVGVNTAVMSKLGEKQLQNLGIAIDARYVRELLAKCGVSLE